MQFCYSEEDAKWPEDADDGWEPPEPAAADFQYLAPMTLVASKNR